ncbi:MAG TPA: hypothetical protein VKA34_23480 [Balneolales bacterium]|nr:hypothetical protein [Balneolales bacterium]
MSNKRSQAKSVRFRLEARNDVDGDWLVAFKLQKTTIRTTSFPEKNVGAGWM